MLKRTENTNEILDKIRATSATRHQAIKQIYYNEELRKSIKSYIFKNSGNENDFQDIVYIDNSIVAFVNNVVSRRLVDLTTNIEGYIFSVARNLWLTELRKRKARIKIADEGLSDNLVKSSNPESYFLSNEKSALINKVLGILGKNCKEVLSFWSHGYNMQEIADILGYKSKEMVRKKKCLCLKELLHWLEGRPQLKEKLQY